MTACSESYPSWTLLEAVVQNIAFPSSVLKYHRVTTTFSCISRKAHQGLPEFLLYYKLNKHLLSLFPLSFIWRKNPFKQEVENSSVGSFWPVLKSGIDAAYAIQDKDMVYFFKGTKFWAARANIIEPGFPRNIHRLGFPKNVQKIDAAAYDENAKKTYFFSGDKYWRYDEIKNTMERSYPRPITADFPNIGSRVDAAFQQDGHLYLFNGSKQYEFDSRTKKFLGSKKANSWFGCMEHKKN
nr:PREDICTED: stromelysin-1-like [Anolis carolinensis]|eukprot:XP_016848153.1 PREDICTED: stromelysin-1-like [Anolis carolinensis]